MVYGLALRDQVRENQDQKTRRDQMRPAAQDKLTQATGVLVRTSTQCCLQGMFSSAEAVLLLWIEDLSCYFHLQK